MWPASRKRTERALAQPEGRVVGDLLDEGHGRLDVLGRVERDDRVVHGPALAGVAAPLEGRVLLLDRGGIHEGDRDEIRRRRRRQDGSREAVVNEPWEEAAVVEVGVGEEDEIEVVGRDRERVPVPVEEGPLLMESAVDEAAQAVGLDEVRGPRDLPGRAQESQLHRASQ